MSDPQGKPHSLFDEVHALTAASLDGTATPAESDRLDRLLREDPHARRLYVRYIDISCNLRQWASHSTPEALEAGQPADKGDPPHTLFGFLGDIARWGENLPGMRMFFWMLAGFVGMLVGWATLLAITAALGLFNRQAVNPPAAPLVAARRSEASNPQASIPHLSPPAVFVARLAAADCQWVDPEAALGDGALLSAGQKLELASGRVEIVFQSGAEVMLHGPAIFEIQSANSGFLTIGRLSARAATPQSHGFTVHSRTAATVDLGTEFNIVALDDGHSQIGVVEGAVEVQLANGRERRRLGVGESIEVEPGTPSVIAQIGVVEGAVEVQLTNRRERRRLGVGKSIEVEPGAPSVIARVEPGEGTPAFKFPTIEPPSNRDYADSSQGHANISVFRGQAGGGERPSGPVEVLLDGKGQSQADAPSESFFFANDTSGMVLLDLGKCIGVKKVNTYSWHQHAKLASDRLRAMQKYCLYGSSRATPPGADGDLVAAGWTLIARVNTDEFFGFPEAAARPAQQAVSIAAANGEPIGKYRYLLWDVRPTPGRCVPAIPLTETNTFHGEFDVYAVGKNQG